MSMAVTFDTLRSLANGSISSSYVAVGSPTTSPARVVCITNATDGDMFFSTDGSTNMLFVAKSTYKTFDFTTNRRITDNTFAIRKNTQFYVKQSSAPTSGSVYIELIYGGND